MNKSCVISLKDVSHTFGEKTVLKEVNLNVNEGDFMAITGPNGGGKTTILRLLLHLLKPTKGSVEYYAHGVPATHLKFGYLPQKSAIDSRFPITVEEVVASGLRMRPLHRFTDEERRQISEAIDMVRLSEVRDRAIGHLSGGQLQRALLGRAIISKPSVLVLDEPLNYIDKQFEEHLYQMMEHLSATTTIILVSHEMSVISGMANRHIIISGGRVHECVAHHHFVRPECE